MLLSQNKYLCILSLVISPTISQRGEEYNLSSNPILNVYFHAYQDPKTVTFLLSNASSYENKSGACVHLQTVML